jgi:hypothetical protein
MRPQKGDGGGVSHSREQNGRIMYDAPHCNLSSDVTHPDRGSLIHLITGTNRRGDSHDTVRQSRHRADNLLLRMGK